MAPTLNEDDNSPQFLSSQSSSSGDGCEREQCKLIKSELCRFRSELKGRIQSFKHLMKVNSKLATLDNFIENIQEVIENVTWVVSDNNNNNANTASYYKSSTRRDAKAKKLKKSSVSVQTNNNDNNNTSAENPAAAPKNKESERLAPVVPEVAPEMNNEICIIPETQAPLPHHHHHHHPPPAPPAFPTPPPTTATGAAATTSNIKLSKPRNYFSQHPDNIIIPETPPEAAFNPRNDNDDEQRSVVIEDHDNNSNKNNNTNSQNNNFDDNNQNDNYDECNISGSSSSNNTRKRKRGMKHHHQEVAVDLDKSKKSAKSMKKHNSEQLHSNNNNSSRPKLKTRSLPLPPLANDEDFDPSFSLSASGDQSVSMNGQEVQEIEPDPIFNHPKVLNSLFKYLNSTDLESCSLVNKSWNLVSSLIRPTKYWVIRFTDLENDYKVQEKRRSALTIEAKTQIEVKDIKEAYLASHHKYLENLKKKVELQSEKVKESPSYKTILIISQLPDFQRPEIKEIFSIIAGSVTHLYFGTWEKWGTMIIPEAPFFDLLFALPNCHSLHLFSRGLHWNDTTRRFRGYAQKKMVPFPTLPQIKRISFPEDLTDFPYVLLLRLLKACTSLLNLYNFPLHKSHALTKSMKGHLVRSIGHSRPLKSNGDYFGNCAKICKWARGSRGLYKMTVCFSSSSCHEESQAKEDHEGQGQGHGQGGQLDEQWDALFQHVLLCSTRCMRKLEVYPPDGFKFIRFSVPLPILYHLKLIAIPEMPFEGFFDPALDLNHVFPNVVHVTISVECLDKEMVEEYFPPQQYRPGHLFPNVKKLTLTEKMGENMLKKMRALFPKITELEIRSQSDFFRKWMYSIVRLWPNLEKLTLIVNYFRSKDWETVAGEPFKPPRDNSDFVLDPIVTGFSRERCDALRSEVNWGRDPNVIEECVTVGKFSFRNMKKLRLLKIIYNNMNHSDEFPQFFSPLSFRHGFNLLPELVVFIGIAHDCPRWKDEIIASLTPILPYVEFDKCYFDPGPLM